MHQFWSGKRFNISFWYDNRILSFDWSVILICWILTPRGMTRGGSWSYMNLHVKKYICTNFYNSITKWTIFRLIRWTNNLLPKYVFIWRNTVLYNMSFTLILRVPHRDCVHRKWHLCPWVSAGREILCLWPVPEPPSQPGRTELLEKNRQGNCVSLIILISYLCQWA